MQRLLELLGPAVQFVYTCWDRIVLNGYIERLQRPENLVHFFHDVVGIGCIEPAVLEQRTNVYKAWVRRMTEEQGIPVLPAPPKGQRKDEFVQPFYRRLKGGEGVACVLTSLEQGRTFVSYTPVEDTQWRCQLPLYQGVSKTVPALLLVRARLCPGADEHPCGKLFPVQRHRVLQRPRVRRPGTQTRRRWHPQGRQCLPGGPGCGRAASCRRAPERGDLGATRRLLGSSTGAGLQPG